VPSLNTALESKTLAEMAAIIAQMNLRNRARKKRKREQKNYSSSKSTYELHPFDQNFDPKLHNKYFRTREKRKTENKEIMFELDESQIQNRVQKSKSTSKQVIFEGCIIGWKELFCYIQLNLF
jgi:hypothetical protein